MTPNRESMSVGFAGAGAAISGDVIASRMSRHIDGLAAALAGAGAPSEPSMRLLELAAVAAMQAASLVELVAAAPEPRRLGGPTVRSARALQAVA